MCNIGVSILVGPTTNGRVIGFNVAQNILYLGARDEHKGRLSIHACYNM